MMRASTWKPRLQTGLGLAAAAALVYAASSLLVTGADNSAEPQKTAAPEAAPKDDAKAATKEAPKDDSKAAPKSPPKAAPKTKKPTGSELYAIHCNRCHPERYPTEFTSAQWKTVVTHMRVRANLPAVQAKEILKYLQEESGN